MCRTEKDVPNTYKEREQEVKHKKHKVKLKPYKRNKYRDNQVSKY